ncbi:MAG: type II CAAX endopeptidase family protein [Erysipelothrix sp.]
MKKNNYKRILIFLIFVMVLQVPLTIMYAKKKDNMYLTILMMTPALSMILTRIITREGFADIRDNLNIKSNWSKYLKYYFMPFVLSFIGAILYFGIMPSKFDPLGSHYARDLGTTNLKEYYSTLLVVVPLAVIFNPIGGLIQCFSEEIAWRGYLFNKLSQIHKKTTAMIISNTIWGLWHAPLIYLGFNYELQSSIISIIAMVIFCNIVGAICSYAYIETGSIAAPVIFHAAINGLDKLKPSSLFMSSSPNLLIGPNLIGIVGGIGLIIWGLLCYMKCYKSEQNIDEHKIKFLFKKNSNC